MSLRFRKSIKLAPGVKLNLGKKSVGVSVGGKYGGVSYNSRNGARARVSAPGTGLSYSTSLKSGEKAAPAPAPVEKQKKPFYKSWLFWADVIVVLLLLSSCSASPVPDTTVVSLSPSPAASTPLPTAAPAEPTPAPSADPEIRDYVLNTSSCKFHFPSCDSVEKIKPSNREAFTGTRQELIQRGFDSCGICHP